MPSNSSFSFSYLFSYLAISFSILSEYFFSFFISFSDDIFERRGNIFSGVFLRQMIVSERGYTYFVWNSSRVRLFSFRKSLMNWSFSL